MAIPSWTGLNGTKLVKPRSNPPVILAFASHPRLLIQLLRSSQGVGKPLVSSAVTLSRLLDAILRAEGYVTQLSPPGPDGGVDTLARRGTLGLEGPRMCVQVKSSNNPSDVTVFRGLQGSMATFKADEGLLVSWGGFNNAVQREARLSFFSVRLWDADDLLEAITRNYDHLPEELQKDLPLKRIWALVPGDSEGE